MKINKPLITLLLLAAGSISYAKAQLSTFHDPISFKLKNGMNIIIAENTGTSKVYSTFAADDTDAEQITPTQTIINVMLNEIALNTHSGISFNDKGGNLNNSIAGFENALLELSSCIINADLNKDLFEKAKSAVLKSVHDRLKYYPSTMTENSVEAITLEEVKAHFHNKYQPAKASLTIAGNITPSEAKNVAKKAFGSWKGNQVESSSISR